MPRSDISAWGRVTGVRHSGIPPQLRGGMGHEPNSVAPREVHGPGRADSLADEQYAACLECLTRIDGWLVETSLSSRTKAAMVRHLHYLLQYLTIATDHSVRSAPRSAIDAWLTPTRGLGDYDLRVTLLNLLARKLAVQTLETPDQPGSRLWRRLREFLFWGAYQRRVTARTRDYFVGITQDDILDSERACIPFYDALNASSPARDFSGVFVESDKVIVERIVALNRVPNPSIVDIGCGRGRLLTTLRDRFKDARLIGTSIFAFNDDERATLEEQSIRPLYCAAQHVNLDDDSQEIVVSSEVIEHLRHPEDLIKEIHRILKPGGVFCVTAPSRASYLYGPNPLSYVLVALGTILPAVLPRFHNLYAPLTPIPIVHYGFDPHDLQRRFRTQFRSAQVATTRFTALEKFKLAQIAPQIPVLKKMGGLCVAYGTKD